MTSDFGGIGQESGWERGDLTVRLARTFIMNYYEGKKSAGLIFDSANTSPVLPAVGSDNSQWEQLRSTQPSIWEDPMLRKAGEEFAKLILAQRKAFEGKKGTADYKEKALNIAIVSAWAYTAGLLSDNPIRLDRHYGLSEKTGRDPLNSSALAKGSHKTDPLTLRALIEIIDIAYMRIYKRHFPAKGKDLNSSLTF